MIVYPSFPEYDLSPKRLTAKDTSDEWKEEPHWANHRAIQEGGGPSIFTSLACTKELSKFLNQPYNLRSVNEWETRIKDILDSKNKNNVFKTCKKCGYVTSVPKQWVYCPECGNKLQEDGK
jgi:predicted nucleic-acid-binding Zn-ribbon protein